MLRDAMPEVSIAAGRHAGVGPWPGRWRRRARLDGARGMAAPVVSNISSSEDI